MTTEQISPKRIQVFKDHFISVLCGIDIMFPVRLWCRLLCHVEHQLNLLRTSPVDPAMSAFEIMNGKHNYNSNLFALLAYAVKLHVMPSKRKTWEQHTKSGFYVGNSWEHYRCHKVWILDTKNTAVGKTVFSRLNT